MKVHLLAAALSLLPAKRHNEAPAIVETIERNLHLIDPFVLLAWGWRESKWQPKKHGKHGERGVLQVGYLALIDLRRRFSLWKGARISDLVLTDEGVSAGLDYLRLLKERGDGTLRDSMRRYNPGSRRYCERILDLADDLRAEYGWHK